MKDLQRLFYLAFVLILISDTKCDVNELKECLDKDSISCLQMQLFRNARALMSQESIDLAAGMSLVKESEVPVPEGRSNNLEMLELEQRVENATDVASRQEAIQDFLVRRARDVVLERTIRWDVGQSIRNILNVIPQAIKAKFTNYVTEARGKGKKLLRILVPLLIGLKVKMAGLAAITFLGIAVLAKKALLASLISILISGFIGLKKLIASKKSSYEEVAVAPYPVPTWNHAPVPVPAPVYDSHADYSAQKIAYSGHAPA